MGDPKKIRKKYDTPSHPWIKSRIDEEREFKKEFGTRSKKEIWKAETLLKKFKSQAKKLIALSGPQAEIEKEHLFRRIKELGLAQGSITFDVILGLTVSDVLARRLQSVLVAKELARTVKQARQFIVHGHVLVNGKKITAPSYLVSVAEESSLSLSVGSSLLSEDHPERASPARVAEMAAAKQVAEDTAAKENAKAAKKAEAETKETETKEEATEESASKESSTTEAAEEKGEAQ
jgi:small subunit ribosomal protein S4